MIKPDAVQRRLVGRIVSRFEEKGLRIAGMRLVRMSRKQARELYAVHEGKPFHGGLVKFVTSGPAVVMVLEGHRAVSVVRRMLGATKGFDAEPGTIRGDFGGSERFNLAHGSDSAGSARREIGIFFRGADLAGGEPVDLPWVCLESERK
jgi:nucleoside-diphosphate kinase